MSNSKFCQSCKDERAKKGLPPVEKVKLPAITTPNGPFRRPRLSTTVCPYCDGETLIANSVRVNPKPEPQ